jgi:ribosomal protein L40E
MADEQLFCEKCHQQLDPTDKFCRQCGLPTLRQAQAQKRVPDFPPDTAELERNFEVQPDPAPFLRDNEADREKLTETPTTGDILRVTSPTQAVRSASVTIVMVGLIIFMVLAGAALLILAFRFP